MFLALALTVSGQEQRNVRDFEYIRSTTPWLSSRNAAGLGELPVDRIANVEALFHKHDGGLIGIEESDNSFEAGASTEAFIKLSDRFALHGRLEYRNFSGKNMGGPLLMDPSYNPLNFYESVDTTVGVKNRELYNLMGGFAYSFNKKWSIGAEIDYISGDQSKRKDPRFMNVWMDLNVSAGVRFAPSEVFSVGANFIYKRTLESLSGKTFGTTDKTYYTFVDFGGFYGSRELFDGTFAYVPTSEVRPMFNSFLGGAIQIAGGGETKIFNEITFLHRNGYYGKKSSTTVTYTEHSSNIIEYNGVLTTGQSGNHHRVGLDFRYEGLTNMKNNYKLTTPEGSYTVVEYSEQNEVLKQNDISGAISYNGFLGVENHRAVWEYGVSANGNMRQSATTIYPFARTSSVTHIDARLFGKHNLFVKERNMMTFALEGLFAMGFGNPKNDEILASSSSDAPKSMDLYLNKDFEYKTAMQAGGCLTVRYTRFFKKNIAFYVEAKDRFDHLLKKAEYLPGNYRNILEVKVGCTF